MHTESGFLAFDCTNESIDKFIETYMDFYRTGNVFKLNEWHDCEVLDKTIEKFPLYEYRNLTPHAKKGDHVFVNYFWPYMDHKKGEKRKKLGRSPEYNAIQAVR